MEMEEYQIKIGEYVFKKKFQHLSDAVSWQKRIRKLVAKEDQHRVVLLSSGWSTPEKELIRL